MLGGKFRWQLTDETCTVHVAQNACTVHVAQNVICEKLLEYANIISSF